MALSTRHLRPHKEVHHLHGQSQRVCCGPSRLMDNRVRGESYKFLRTLCSVVPSTPEIPHLARNSGNSQLRIIVAGRRPTLLQGNADIASSNHTLHPHWHAKRRKCRSGGPCNVNRRSSAVSYRHVVIGTNCFLFLSTSPGRRWASTTSRSCPPVILSFFIGRRSYKVIQTRECMRSFPD